MKYIKAFGRSLSAVVFGGDRIRSADPGITDEFLDGYVCRGGNFIDTARIYGMGDCEAALGAWLVRGDNRKKVFVGTKGGHPDPSTMHKGRLDGNSLEYDIKKSLEALKTDRVDMYYLHRDDTSRPVGDILETLNGFIQQGYTDFIGASNWRADRLEEARIYAEKHGLAGFSADQPQFSLAKQCRFPDDTLVSMDGALYAYHKKTGMACVAYSSQARGYFMKLQRNEPLSDLTRTLFDCPENRAVFEKIQASGLDACAASLCYVTNQPFPSFAIAGFGSMAQLRNTLECVDTEINGDEVAALRIIREEI